jgi:hypothetical protein
LTTLELPVVLLFGEQLLAPPGGWNESAQRLLTAQLAAAAAQLSPAGDADWQQGQDGAVLLKNHCTQLACRLSDLAKAAEDAPPLAAALARGGFGQLALQLATLHGPDAAASAVWVRRKWLVLGTGCC